MNPVCYLLLARVWDAPDRFPPCQTPVAAETHVLDPAPGCDTAAPPRPAWLKFSWFARWNRCRHAPDQSPGRRASSFSREKPRRELNALVADVDPVLLTKRRPGSGPLPQKLHWTRLLAADLSILFSIDRIPRRCQRCTGAVEAERGSPLSTWSRSRGFTLEPPPHTLKPQRGRSDPAHAARNTLRSAVVLS